MRMQWSSPIDGSATGIDCVYPNSPPPDPAQLARAPWDEGNRPSPRRVVPLRRTEALVSLTSRLRLMSANRLTRLAAAGSRRADIFSVVAMQQRRLPSPFPLQQPRHYALMSRAIITVGAAFFAEKSCCRFPKGMMLPWAKTRRLKHVGVRRRVFLHRSSSLRPIAYRNDLQRKVMLERQA
jgi:hypothetical protein